MTDNNNSPALPLILTLMAAVFLQLLFVFAESRQTPNRVATDFAHAYFKLDPGMGQLMVNHGLTEDDMDLVDAYLYHNRQEARQRGLALGMLKSQLFHVRTYTLERGEQSARIRVTGKRRAAINPVFYIVAKLFHLGQTHEVDAVLELTKAKGRWRVSGKPFEMALL